MKYILLLICFFPFATFSQMHPSCCQRSLTEQFAVLASNDNFAAAHLAPLPLNFTPEKGKMISYPCEDGKIANAFEVKAEKPTDNWLIVIHEWWGLNDYIKREAERFQTELGNVNVLAIDLYDGKIAETPALAQELMGSMVETRIRAIIAGGLKYTGSTAKIQTVGWCFGGGWSLQTSLMAEKQAKGCVMYYGMPEKDLTKLKNLNPEVLGIFGSKDGWITPEVVSKFQKDMKSTGKKLTVKTYPAEHAFANPSNPKYDKVSAEDAHKVAVSFLKSHLK